MTTPGASTSAITSISAGKRTPRHGAACARRRPLAKETEPFATPPVPCENASERPAPKVPRPHQVEAVAAAVAHFSKHARGRLVMPCGTGKSLTSILIAEALGADTIVVAAPSLALIRQNLGAWKERFDALGKSFDRLCVCSDRTVGADEDEFVHDPSELGIDVTTDVHSVVVRLRKPRTRPLVVFVTYHSSPLLAEAATTAKFTFDLAFLDEAHKTVGAEDRAFATLLDEGRIAIRARVAMTATERVYRGGRSDVLSMDSEEDFGACFYRLSFKAAIERDLICDYKIVTFFVRESEIRSLIEKNARLRLDVDGRKVLHAENAGSLAAGIALKAVMREYGARHAITFHRSIRAAANFSFQQDAIDAFDGVAVRNLHVSGAMPTSTRSAILDEFASAEIACVSNAKCLTEGIDVPNTDCILFEGPKQSVIDIAQAAGRAMRNHPGKEFGYIIVPVVVPEDKTFEEFVETTEFRKVAQTLTAMSTQDDRLQVEFRTIWSGGARARSGEDTGGGDGIVVMRGHVPDGAGVEFGRFVAAVQTKVWSSRPVALYRPFEEARAFVHGLGLKGVKEWKAFAKSGRKPSDIPNAVDRVYKTQGWKDWGDFIGTGNVADAKKNWRPFEEARAFAMSLGLKTSKDWWKFVTSGRKPPDIPSHPDIAYAGKGFTTLGDFTHGESRGRSRRPEDLMPSSRGASNLLPTDPA